MIVWLIAGLLGLATGLRIGWSLVNQQSVVSAAMIVALGSLAVLAALNWPPLTLLIDSALGWPNISIGLSQVALVASAAGSCVMITSVASTRDPAATRRLAFLQYVLAAAVAGFTAVLFAATERQPEMAPREYLARNLDSTTPWLVPLLYVALAMTLASWVGMRFSNATRRGRALFLFSAGTALIVATSGFFLIRAARAANLPGVGTAATLLLCALAVIAAGSLLPALEDWFGARREMRLIAPLMREMQRRHPDIGIGVRPRGPLVFRVAERLSLISDSLYLEAMSAERADAAPDAEADPVSRARDVARWIHAGVGAEAGSAAATSAAAFPGRECLRQPDSYSDRDWVLEIARQFRDLAERKPGVRPGRLGQPR